MAEKQVQRRLAAILAADVVGYSRLMEQHETGTLTALKARRKEVLEPLVARHHGRIFKLTGDGVLVEFASAVARAERHPLPTSHAMPAAFSMESSGGSSWGPALAGSRSLLLAGSAHGKEKASNEANFPLGISAQARETKPIVCKAKPIPHQTKPFLHPAAKRGGVSGWQDPEQAKSSECHDLSREHQDL